MRFSRLLGRCEDLSFRLDYIRVWVQETSSPKHPLKRTLFLDSKFVPSLKIAFSN